MSIAAANVLPIFDHLPSSSLEDLIELQEPGCILEYEGHDDDGVAFFVFSIGGFLGGEMIHPSMLGGQVIIITADDRYQATEIAVAGLETTINAELDKKSQEKSSLDALARLSSIGKLDRLEQAQKPDAEKSTDFVADVDAIRPLIGDDIVLTSGMKPN